MKTLLIALSILSANPFNTTQAQNTFIGKAENSHYIACHCGCDEHYYIEEDLEIHAGDTVVITKDENIYIVDCNH